ncbi:integrase [Aminobacter sp. Y103A]|uniref:IS481 family transposase n=1 Tax=Aminobacter sp. Y103A TaxID=1870862 RepID=UPI002572F8FB|nr:IS481 family transposase [Aminobacter sp. SS-2016]BBD35373.1 integrase [Aminobacter sp. SS-2016]
MNVHKNARLTPSGRVLLVQRIEQGWSVRRAAGSAGVSERTAYRWLDRYRAGDRVLHDRSSAPHRCRHRLAAMQVSRIEQLRRQRMTGPAIARSLGLARSTVGLVLRRLGLNRLAWLDPRPPVLRYERSLGRDDATGFLNRALAWYARLGARVERVMTDNGSAYRSKLFAQALQGAGARHIRTRPYTPRTNGKAERFIQTSLRGWAYARPYASSNERAKAIHQWAANYNLARPHSALGGISPFQRLNNLLGNDT